MRTVFGLDFGTTNSALAVNAQGNTEVIDIDPHNPTEKTMRSEIFMDHAKPHHVQADQLAPDPAAPDEQRQGGPQPHKIDG
jgi:molecular chaperone DnaK (HSP70)